MLSVVHPTAGRVERGSGISMNGDASHPARDCYRLRRDVRESGQARVTLHAELSSFDLVSRRDVKVPRIPAPATVVCLLGVDEEMPTLMCR
jgi:hypothetical protein